MEKVNLKYGKLISYSVYSADYCHLREVMYVVLLVCVYFLWTYFARCRHTHKN